LKVNHIFGTSVPNSEPPTAAELQGDTATPIDSLVSGSSSATEGLATPAEEMVDETAENQNDPAPNINEPEIMNVQLTT